MTQLLLIESSNQPSFGGVVATPASQSPHLSEGSIAIFGHVEGVWKLSPDGHELDFVVDEARRELLSCGSLVESALGQLLIALCGSRCRFALFWASDWRDLPVAHDASELLSLVEEQLRTRVGNWELYALCTPIEGPAEIARETRPGDPTRR